MVWPTEQNGWSLKNMHTLSCVTRSFHGYEFVDTINTSKDAKTYFYALLPQAKSDQILFDRFRPLHSGLKIDFTWWMIPKCSKNDLKCNLKMARLWSNMVQNVLQLLNKTENFSVYKHSKNWLNIDWILAAFGLHFECILTELKCFENWF